MHSLIRKRLVQRAAVGLSAPHTPCGPGQPLVGPAELVIGSNVRTFIFRCDVFFPFYNDYVLHLLP